MGRIPMYGQKQKNPSIFNVGLTIAASLIAVVACGPRQKDYVPITKPMTTVQAKGVASCRQQLARKQVHIPKDASSAKGFALCGLPPGSVDPKARALSQQTVRYSVTSAGERFDVNMNVELSLPDKMPTESATLVRSALYGCQDEINRTWRRSSSETRLRLNLSLIDPLPQSSTSQNLVEQRIRLVDSVGANGEATFIMSQWPDKSALHLSPQSADLRDCLALPAGKQVACTKKALNTLNAGFCADFSMMVNQWAGLDGDESLVKACAAITAQTPSPTAKRGSAELASLGDITPVEKARTLPLMKAYSAIDAQTYFEEARLSNDEVMQILTPACPDLKDANKDLKIK
jgi:hypothetical protein